MLINTGLRIPPEHLELVPRKRLVERLEAGLKRKLTLLSAPAGYGKTTLLSQWASPLNDRGLHVAWISLDEGDNSSECFWECIFTGLNEALETSFRSARVAPSDVNYHPLDDVLIKLINQFSQGDFGHTVIVLDDFHHITSPEILHGLDFFLARLSHKVHLILSGRSDPSLKLGQLRALDQVVELKAADLRFTSEEAAAYLKQLKGLDLSSQALERLIFKSEGWAVGLQLAALALSALSGQEQEDFIRNFSGAHQYIQDYLAEQVLHQQPPDLQAFLMQTCILERFTESLCSAVADRQSRHASLATLEAANIFLVPLDDERRWFRYHRLFAEFLRDLLYRTFPDLVPALHRRAVQWFEGKGYLEEAVQHALETKDHDLVAQLIIQLRQIYGSQSHVKTLLKLMQALPQDYIPSRPNLCLGYAWSYAISGKFNQVDALLKLVESYLRRNRNIVDNTDSANGSDRTIKNNPRDRKWKDTLAELQADVDLLHAFMARFTPYVDGAMQHGKRALERIPAGRLAQRGIALLFIGHTQLLLGDDPGAMQNLTAAMTANEMAAGYSAYLSALNYMTQLLVLHGRLEEALSLNRQALHFVNQQPIKVLAGIEQIGLGDLLRERNHLDDAERYIDQGINLAERGGDFVFMRDGYLARARLCLAADNSTGALQAIHQAERLVQRDYPAWDTAVVGAWKARLLLAQGNLAAAEQWAQRYQSEVEDLVEYAKELVCLTLARLRLAQGRLAGARRLLERLLYSSEAAGRTGRVIEVLIIQALVFQAMDDNDQAFKKLDRALTLAEPQGYVRVFLDEGEPMATLLRSLARHRLGASQPYLDSMLEAFGPTGPSTNRKTISGHRPVEPNVVLSDRELQVLKLIEVGKSYQEIADELVIALSTVQTHIKNVYSKLGVHSGLQAVSRAKELSLLHSSKTQSMLT